ncbi:MAG: substrate-binding domain-containing protein, partial [Desulfitobacterium hafniense]|nr:substrate-binding domain-containing protein [Desulfitobacterium hafniense]
MKRTINNKLCYLTLITSLLLVFGLAGCASKSAPPPQSSQTSQPTNTALILATTTSTQDSGLLDVLVPQFEQKTGYKVKTIAVGTGAALAMGEKGEADVLLVHAPSSEKKLIDEKTGINYQLIMHNDFVLVGPSSDPAKIKGIKTTRDAFKAIAESKSIFVSRGDDSGTHKMEKDLWKKANIAPSESWYQESGSGMGQTLTIASDKEG